MLLKNEFKEYLLHHQFKNMLKIKDDEGNEYAIYPESLRKEKKDDDFPTSIYLASNTQTKEIGLVKIHHHNKNYEHEVQFMQARHYYFGKRQRTVVCRNGEVKHEGYIFMELLPGITLAELIEILNSTNQQLSDSEQAKLLRALLLEWKAMVGCKIIRHNDIHERNIIIDILSHDREWRAYIIDYDCATDIAAYDTEKKYLHDELRNIMDILFFSKLIKNESLSDHVFSLRNNNHDILNNVNFVINATEKYQAILQGHP